MNKFFSLIKRAPKRMTAAVVMLLAAIIIPATLFAYGPDRPTYTMENPAGHVTFDSITDNPVVGDERNFVRIRQDVAGTTYGKSVNLVPGQTYDVEIYYHNNAATDTNASGVGIAKDTALRIQMPGEVDKSATANINGYISASNATPGTVWDTANAVNTSAGDVTLRYVPNSAVITSNGAVNGSVLPDSLFTTGTKLGYDKLDGTIPGCTQYSGFVNFKFTVDQSNFTVQKQVSTDSGKTWSTNATANPGDTLQYRVIYQNTGTTEQDNVVLSDGLPKNVSYVAGSSLMANSVTGGKYAAEKDGITTTGLNVGNYQPQGNVYFKYSAKIADSKTLACGKNVLTNVARATTSGGWKEASATVTVNNDCKPPVNPCYTCDALTATLVSDTTYKFNGSATANNGATITGYSLDFGDGSAPFTGSSVSNVNHTYPAKDGTYTARLTVTVSVNGSNKTITSDACAVKVTIKTTTPPTPSYTCDALTASLVSDTTYKFNGSATANNGATITGYSLDFGDGSTPFTGSAVSNVNHTYPAKDGTYTARLTATVSVNGSNKTVTSDACAVKVTIKTTTPPTPSYTCDALTASLVSDTTYTFNGSASAKDGATITGYSLDFGDGSTPFTGSAVSGVTHQYAQTGGTYTARLTATVSLKDSNKTITSDACTVKITINQPSTTPPTLPETGTTGTVASLIGIGAIALSVSYYILSRRAAMNR